MSDFKENLIRLLHEESVRTGASMASIILELAREHEEVQFDTRNLMQEMIKDERNLVRKKSDEMIIEAFKKCCGNARKAALSLGMPKSTYHDHMKRLGLASYRSKLTASKNSPIVLPAPVVS